METFTARLHQDILAFTLACMRLNLINWVSERRINNRAAPTQKKMRIRAGDWLSFTGSHCNGTLHGILCFNVRHWRRSPPCSDAAGAVRLSRGRKLEIFISNTACKVHGAPPLQVIFMGPPRSNELIFTFYAFILVCPRRAPSALPAARGDRTKKNWIKKGPITFVITLQKFMLHSVNWSHARDREMRPMR